MATPHHQTFDRLVNDQTGFVGRVAYTFYKNDKLAWIRGFHDKHGRAPDKAGLLIHQASKSLMMRRGHNTSQPFWSGLCAICEKW